MNEQFYGENIPTKMGILSHNSMLLYAHKMVYCTLKTQKHTLCCITIFIASLLFCLYVYIVYLSGCRSRYKFGYHCPVFVFQSHEFRGCHEIPQHQIQGHLAMTTNKVYLCFQPSDDVTQVNELTCNMPFSQMTVTTGITKDSTVCQRPIPNRKQTINQSINQSIKLL